MRHRYSALLLCVSALMVGAASAHAKPQGVAPVPETPAIPIFKSFPGLTEEQVERIMTSSRKVQDCLASEGKEPLRRLQEMNLTNSKKIQALCEAGKHEEAQSFAITQARALAASEDMQIINKCRESIQTMSKDMEEIQGEAAKKNDPASSVPKNVCEYVRH